MHSPLAPSSAYRWVVCPGSVQLGAQCPEQPEGEAAAEGTAAHHVGSEILLRRPAPVGSIAPNGVVITEEMADGAELWVQDVYGVLGTHGLTLADLQVEQRVQVPRIHEQCYGTPDTWLFAQQAGHLYLWDFKFGHGVVEAFENWQLLTYVCGVLDLLGIDGRNDQHMWVHMRVVQPRAYHREGRVREWKVLACDLRAYFNTLNHSAHEAMGANPHTLSGPHCLHCPAAASCPTLRRATWSAADYIGAVQLDNLSPGAAAYELTLLEHMATLLKARIQAREVDVTARVKRGERVPGYALEPTYGRRKWKDKDQARDMGDLFGVDLRKPEELITPTQAATLFQRMKVDTGVILEYSETPATGMALVPDTQILNRARAAFGALLEQ